ncbi:MAG: DUF481 domain-containing protein [Opitutaceae bacterium]|jgi:hypothetical protein|nr:DUF481 domain-containing protein [Opitutaceae bacterium]
MSFPGTVFARGTARRRLLAAALLATACQAAPTRLDFKNGDALTGEVKAVDAANGTLTLATASLGTLVIKQSELKVVPPAPAPQTAAAPAPAKPAPAPTAAAKPPATTGKNTPPAPKPPAPVKGKFEVGVTLNRGRTDLSNIYLLGELSRASGNSQHRLYARYFYGEQNNVTSNDRLDAWYRYRYEISGGVRFLQSQTTYFRDVIADISANYEQNISIGQRLVNNARKRHTLNAGLGLTGRYRETDSENAETLLAELFQDYTCKFSNTISLVQNFSFQYAPDALSRSQYMGTTYATRDGATIYKFKFYAGLTGKLSPKFTFNLRLEYEYDNAIADAALRENERLIATLGYSF